MSSENTGFEIAIIGMAGRFPGSKNVNELWKNLCEGKNLITHFTKEELLEQGIPEVFIDDPNYVKARGIIEDVDKFDADLFGFYPKEIEALDPQQRLFLECSWEALEDAGYKPDGYDGMVGVFGGIGMNTYILQFLNSSDLVVSAEGYQLSLGNDKDFVTTRVSYKLNLNGPSMDIQTACSTSLVSTHVACMNLLNYQCDLAIAGGATISLPQKNGYHYQEGMILSPDGYCRPFDDKAGGTVASNGVATVVLKRLQDAIDDKDEIYAVIKGSAYNNDGSVKVGYTAPGVNGQSEVIAAAYGMAEVPMETIGYIETHGTGTSLGDPIEIDALTQTFSQETNKKQFCAIGSVKSNIGHLDTAAGVTGLIKAALSIYHGKMVPSINYTKANSKINFSETPFFVNTELKDWECTDTPRRAAVSSFGIGGTNVHAVLEQAPTYDENKDEYNDDYLIFPISANTTKSNKESEKRLVDFLETNEKNSIAEIAYTLSAGRKEFNSRSFTVAKNIETLKDRLAGAKNGVFRNKGKIIEEPSIVFMFSGQGSQYVNMCKDLYESNENFKKHADSCFKILLDNHKLDLKSIIYTENPSKEASEKLKQTEFTQPALFVIEYSLAKTLIDFGIVPSKLVGHSIGEYVAACISGVMDLSSALNLVYLRGSLMQKLEKGTMMSITLPESELKNILPENLDLAVINSPNLCVVSGRDEDIIEFEKELTKKEISSAFLYTSHAFHSRMMDPVLKEFYEVVASIKLSEPKIQYMSNVTGNLITNDEAVNPNYYVNHLRYTVRFAENISNLLEDEKNVFVEVGPGSTLSSLAKLCGDTFERTIINSARHPNQQINDVEMLYSAIGNLWLAGVKIDWDKFYKEIPGRIHIPTYAFDKKRYWLKMANNKSKDKLHRTLNDWLYSYGWKRTQIGLLDNQINDEFILVFEDESHLVSSKLRQNGVKEEKIIRVIPSDEFKQVSDQEFNINLNSEEDYKRLNKSLNNLEVSIEKVFHSLFLQDFENSDFSDEYGFISLINIAKYIIADSKSKIDFYILTNNLFDVIGQENISSDKATILGAIKVIPQEQKNINIKLIDLLLSKDNHELSDNIMNELSNNHDSIVAVRGKYRWVQSFENLEINNHESDTLLVENGVYIITGGLGRMSLTFAEYLAKSYSANLVLLDQIDFPEQESWEGILKETNDKNPYEEKIKKLIEIQKYAKSISVAKCNIANKDELELVIDDVLKKQTKINGVIHAAGIVGEGTVNLISEFDKNNYNKQLIPKILGTKNIGELVKKYSLDFVLIQSSLSSVLGGVGFASYSAVNNFVDAYVSKLNCNNTTKWISVNWDAWSFNKGERGITAENGTKLLEIILKKNTPSNIIVSIDDLNESIDKWILGKKNQETESENNINEDFHERPELDTNYVEPSTELEKKIYNEWKKLLGIEQIGVNDNFFELGGDSLIGTQLVSRMRKEFNAEIPMVAIFQNATISGIAKLIEENTKDNNEVEKLSGILDMINNMDDDDVKKMLEDKDEK